MALCASFGLAGCAAIEEFKEAVLRWVESEKLPPAERGPFADESPAATVIPPEKPSKKEASKPSKRVKSARKPQRPHTVVVSPPEKPPTPEKPSTPEKPPTPASTKAARPEGTEGQSVPSPSAPPQLPSRWPKAPPPERFSR
jgi:hypothetical protein